MPNYMIKVKSGSNNDTYNVTFKQQRDDAAAVTVSSEKKSDEEGISAATLSSSTADTALSFQVSARFFTRIEDGDQLSLAAAVTRAEFEEQVKQSLFVSPQNTNDILKQIDDVLMCYVREVLANEGLDFTLNGAERVVHSSDFQTRFSKLQSISSLLTGGVFKLDSLADRPALVEGLLQLKSSPEYSMSIFSAARRLADYAVGTGSRLDVAVDLCVQCLNESVNTEACKLESRSADYSKLFFVLGLDGDQRSLLLPQYKLPVSYQQQVGTTGRFVQKRDMPETVVLGCGLVNHVTIPQSMFSERAFEQNPLFRGYQAQLEKVNQCLFGLAGDGDTASVFVSAHLWTDFISKVDAMRGSSTQVYSERHVSEAIVAFCDLLCSEQDLGCYHALVQAGPLLGFMGMHFPDEMQAAQAKVAASRADDERVAADAADVAIAAV